jgi:hypothetical protein
MLNVHFSLVRGRSVHILFEKNVSMFYRQNEYSFSKSILIELSPLPVLFKIKQVTSIMRNKTLILSRNMSRNHHHLITGKSEE